MTNAIYDSVTKRIIDKIESGNMDKWIKSWSASGTGAPINPVSGTEYSGINYLLLSLSDFGNQHWVTYKQAKALGGHVKKGEKSTMIIYYKSLNIKEKAEDGAETEKKIPMLKSYLVFNVEQCEGLPEKFNAAPAPAQKTSNLAEIAKNSRIDLRIGGNRAFYSPQSDYVQMPPVEAFNSDRDFEGTLLHELTHYTGHESRLNRLGKFDRFGSKAYAFEELIAELGSAFACARLGIESTGLQHAEYIGSWLKVLKQDNKAIFKAASEAQKACNFLMEKLQTSEQSLIQKAA